jgi:hypothetical protein
MIVAFLFLSFPNFLNEGYARPILANSLYIVYPIFLCFLKPIPFILNLKNAGVKFLSYWLLGSLISYLGYFLFHSIINISLVNWFYLSCIISFIFDFWLLYKNQFKIKPLLEIKFSLRSVACYLAILIIYFLLYPFLLKNSVNLTDNFNHQTVVNSLLNGSFSFFPSNLSLSLQLNSYTTLFHYGLSISNLFFSQNQLIKFYEINQYLMIIVITYFINSISIQITKNRYIGYIISGIFIFASGPIPTFNHTSLVPSLIHIILTFGVMLYILEINTNKGNKSFLIGLLLLGYFSFHFVNTLLMIPVLTIFYLLFSNNTILKLKLAQVSPILSQSLVIVAYIIIAITLITRFKPLSYLPNLASVSGLFQQLLSSEANKTVGGLVRSYALGLSPFVYITSLLGVIVLAFSKSNVERFISLILIGIVFLSHIPIFFTERIGLSFVISTLIIILCLVLKFGSNTNYKLFLTVCLLGLIATPIIENVTKQDYYTKSFWNTNSYAIIEGVRPLIEANTIDRSNTIVVSDPMTNQMIEAVYNIKGEGSYASIDTRTKLIALLNTPDICNTKQDKLLINSARVEDWKKLKEKALILNNNIWFDSTESNFTIELIKCS